MTASSAPPAAGLTRQIGTLLTGTTSVQLIGVLLSPVIGRIYGPLPLGEVVAATVIASALATVATLSLDAAIVLVETHEEATELAAVVATLAACAAACVFTALSLIGKQVSSIPWLAFLAHRAVFWAGFVSSSAFLLTLTQVLSALATRQNRFSAISSGRVGQSVMSNGLTILLGLAGWGSVGAALAYLFGQLTITLVLFVSGGITPASLLRAMPSSARSRQLLLIHRRFPLYSYPQSVLDALRENALIGAIAAAGGPVGLGYWAMVNRTLRGPLAMIGNAFTQVFTARAASTANAKEPLLPLVRWISLRAGIIAGVTTATLLTVGPLLFRLVFGASWVGAGEMARIFVPWLAMNFFVSPFVQLAFVLHRNRPFLAWGVLYNLGLIAISIVGAKVIRGDALLVTLSLFGGAALFCVLLWLIRAARSFDVRLASGSVT